MPSQLQELRALTEFSGAVHEKQMHQLRIWPVVAYPRSPPLNAIATIDPENKIVAYQISWKNTSKTKTARHSRQAGSERLALWVRELFGSSWSVAIQIMIAGKQEALFEFVRNDPPPSRADPFDALRSTSWSTKFKKAQEKKNGRSSFSPLSPNEIETPTT